MKITIEDDLGNVKVISGEEATRVVLDDCVQDYFTPCQGCDRIVLYEAAIFEEDGPFCGECGRW